MEVGQTVLALDFVDSQLDFSEGVVFIVLEVGEGDFEDTALEGIVGVLETGGSVYEGFTNTVCHICQPSRSFVLNLSLSSGRAHTLWC